MDSAPGSPVTRRSLWPCAVAAVSLLCASGAMAYDIVDRWTRTQTDGGGIQRGDAITVTWSFVPDGVSYSRLRDGSTDLISYLDDGWNVPEIERTPDLTNRVWWDYANQAYEQYTRVSGLTLIYVPEQNPDGSDSGFVGDIRIGGGYIDGPGGTLANNTFPNTGDMKVDTGRDGNDNPVNLITEAAWRNVVAHESGHGMGLSHTVISGANALMEANLQTGFFGLQFDDVYAINRLYGDPLEKDGGNDSFNNATDLGTQALGSTLSMGDDANFAAVTQFDDDWLGIDGNTDIDYFRFTLDTTTLINLLVTPLGPTYTTDEQGPDTDFSAQADLNVTLYDAGQQQVAASDTGDAGDPESFLGLMLQAGDYVIAVEGEADLNQFYQLALNVSEESFEAQLIYDAESGGLTIDTDGLSLTGYQLDGSGFLPENHTPVLINGSSTATQTLVSESSSEAGSGLLSIGELLPAKLTPGQLDALLTSSTYDTDSGVNAIDFEIVFTYLPGDLDQDGDIDGLDLGIAFANFTGPTGSGQTVEQGDLDGDGDVDGVDLGLLYSIFTGPQAAPVPEPAAMVKMMGVAALLVTRRRSSV